MRALVKTPNIPLKNPIIQGLRFRVKTPSVPFNNKIIRLVKMVGRMIIVANIKKK